MSGPAATASKLSWARVYAGFGWAVLPVHRGTKKVALDKWLDYQTRRPTDVELTTWFGDGSQYELAILCGNVSGGLVVRDFDTAAGYASWKAEHPDEARRLPTVRTARGFHVYGTCPNAKSRKLADGELRAKGLIVLAPPSRHPDGPEYSWVNPPDGPPNAVDPVRIFGAPESKKDTEDTGGQKPLGVLVGETPGAGSDTPCAESKDTRRTQDDTGEHRNGLCDHLGSPVSSVSGECGAAIEHAIRISLPTAAGQRNKGVFTLCRALKAIPEVAVWDMGKLMPIVRAWHRLAYPNIATKDFGTTLADFNNGWPKVKVPLGVPYMEQVLERARAAPVPECVKGLGEKVELLARVCAELQKANGGATFYLGCRDAGALMGMGHDEANRLLRLMQELKVIEVVAPGTRGQKGKATEYRILWHKESKA